MTEAQLRTALDGGKTLAQVAKSKGKSVDGLVKALVADAKARLADAVKDGRLTQAQSKAMQSGLEARIAEQVEKHAARPADARPRPGPRPGARRRAAGERRGDGLDVTDATVRARVLGRGRSLSGAPRGPPRCVQGLTPATAAADGIISG